MESANASANVNANANTKGKREWVTQNITAKRCR